MTAVIDGRFVDNLPHLERLDRSLREIGIANPHAIAEWEAIQSELVRRNGLREGTIYLQVTRGVWEREFTCPRDLKPTVVAFTQAKSLVEVEAVRTGIAVVTVPDLRWKRRDIKSVALLPQVLAKFIARDAGVAEAWMVADGLVTEGASSTAFLITHAGEIVTRPLSRAVLPGITRQSVAGLAADRGLALVERAFSVEEARAAREVFLTSASTFVMPVVKIDDHPVADGQPGPLTLDLRGRYLAAARAG